MSFMKYKIYSKTLNSEITIKSIRQGKLTINELAEILKIDKKEIIKQYKAIINSCINK